MPDPTLGDIRAALADQIQETLCSGTANPRIEQLQVTPHMNFNPSPPSIDIYPAEVFTSSLAFGSGNVQLNYTVRARVSTAEHEGGQDLLDMLMDPRADTSVLQAIEADDTLGGTVSRAHVGDCSGYGTFPSASASEGNLLGCTWEVSVLP